VVLESNDGDIVSVNLSRTWQYSGDGWNYIANVENVTTGGGEDIIQGNDVANVVDSGAGDDWLYAGGGDDVLIGGEGTDRLFGGDGNDTLTPAAGNDSVDGGAGNDTIVIPATASGVTKVLKGGTGAADVLQVNGAGGTFDLTDVTYSGFETINGEEGGGGATVLVLDHITGVTTIAFDQDGGGSTADTLQLANGTYDFSSTAMTFATAGSTLDLNTDGDTAKTITVDAADIANIGTITGESTASIVTTINLNDTDDLRATTTTAVDVLTIGGTSQTLTVSVDDFT